MRQAHTQEHGDPLGNRGSQVGLGGAGYVLLHVFQHTVEVAPNLLLGQGIEGVVDGTAGVHQRIEDVLPQQSKNFSVPARHSHHSSIFVV